MTERPILFTPGNVQAILAGSKTQTRRIVKLPDAPRHLGTWEPTTVGGPDGVRTKDGRLLPEMCGVWHTRSGTTICCPWSVGDRLWVRETFALWREGFDRRGHVIYRADMKDKDGEDFSQPDLMGLSKWYPSIYMKRIYSRITLEITEVRVERLQEISEEDSFAEGVEYFNAGLFRDYHQPGDVGIDSAVGCYQSLWESINGSGSWEKNPWVWAISFRQVTPEVAE